MTLSELLHIFIKNQYICSVKKVFILFASLSLLLFACTTEFDSTADYKDITVVYGLLDQTDSVTYLKINKAFLGEGDVMLMAKEGDSSSYGNNLEVKVEDWFNNALVKTFVFDTTTIFNKDTGLFYAPKQVLYKANTKAQLNKDHTYKLIVKNTVTGKEIRSQTVLVSPLVVTKPGSAQKFIDFTSEVPGSVEWKSSKNGKKHQLMIRFNYKEISKSGGTDTSFHSIDWLFSPLSSISINGDEPMGLQYVNAYFFDLLQQQIPIDNNLNRFIGKKGYSSVDFGAVEFIFSVATDEFSTYLDVAAPSTSVIQEKPDYTNITNAEGVITNDATGIFAARFHQTRSFKLNELSSDKLKTINRGF